MRRRLLFASFLVATFGVGCSLIVSYDGFGDGARDDAGAGADGANGTDGNGGGDGSGGTDGSDTDAADASGDALDAGADANKRYAIVLLGGRYYPPDATSSVEIADVEYAMINADGTLGPWKVGPPIPHPEDDVGSAAWGSSIFVADDWGSAAAVMLADGGMSSWSTIGGAGRNNPTVVAVDGTLYLAAGDNVANGVNVPNVLRAQITGPQTIGGWTETTPLPADGGPRDDSKLVASGRTLYLLGGYYMNADMSSVFQGTLDDAGAVASWTETTALPGPGSLVRAVVAQSHVTILGGSFATLENESVHTSSIQGNGSLGAWQTGIDHPKRDRCPAVVHDNIAYLISGVVGTDLDTPTVIYAPLDANGFPGTWLTTTSINKQRHSASAVVVEVP
jgi:hypothetical protein